MKTTGELGELWVGSHTQPRPVFGESPEQGWDQAPLLRIARIVGSAILAVSLIAYVVFAFWPREDELIHWPPAGPAEVVERAGDSLGHLKRGANALVAAVA